ncbi:MAG: transposase [Naasia sp.]|nr:transposase [Naasia sp.]
MPDLAEVADELYALLPADFTAARNARVKELRGEDRALAEQVAKLPKPSVAAWAANVLVRRKADEMQQVLELGASLRDAQEHLDPAALRELTGQRRKLVAALAREAVALGEDLGQRVTAPAAEELEQTLSAAMADPWAATALLSGRLVRPLQSVGMDKVDLAGAVAGPPPDGAARRPAPAAESARPAAGKKGSGGSDDGVPGGASEGARELKERERAEREQQEQRARERRERVEAELRAAAGAADADLGEARAALEEAERRRTEAVESRSRLRERQRELEDELAEVERALAGAGRAVTSSGADREDAADRVDRAESRAAAARARLRDATQ